MRPLPLSCLITVTLLTTLAPSTHAQDAGKATDPAVFCARSWPDDFVMQKHCLTKQREAAEFAGITGLRWSEQFHMTREQVHLEEGFIELKTSKAGRPQARILNARAVELLRAQLSRHQQPWVYPNKGNTGPIDQSYFTRYIWIPARKEAGVGNARWNDWRHTFASELTMAGHSDRTVATLLGHTSTQMVARYAHLADAHLRSAVETISQKIANEPRKGRPDKHK